MRNNEAGAGLRLSLFIAAFYNLLQHSIPGLIRMDQRMPFL